MDNLSDHVLNLANSIIGVSILAMPYCFKQCGILLSIFILLISSIISRLACHFLLKSAIIARRKTFEFLAFHIFGYLGKFCVEIGMIGFLLGTCIAFFVVMGDLGPEIVSEMSGVQIGNTLRNSTLIALSVFCVLPLGLLKNVDTLSVVSKATIGFYCCLVIKIMGEALPHIFTGDWVSEVVLWRPAGILQCLPIFSMALFCQTQIFEIYQALPNASLDKMNSLIRLAVNICTCVYIFVGTFGYIAFFQKPFTGNILLSFSPSLISDVMKIGFVLSLAFSFPLFIFPCRASLYSLLYKGPSYTSVHEGAPVNYIPEGKFKMLTLLIVTVSLIIGILIPNIELVLGLIGSTIGVMICVLFPVTCFICISHKNTNERILAQVMLSVGVIVMFMGTYANLYAIEEANLYEVGEKIDQPAQKLVVEREKPLVIDIPLTTIKVIAEESLKINIPASSEDDKVKEVRHEPPQPVEPAESVEAIVSNPPETVDKKPEENVVKVEKLGRVVEPVQPSNENQDKNKEKRKKIEVPEENKVQQQEEKHNDEQKINVQEAPKEVAVVADKKQKNANEVDIQDLKKEETELNKQKESLQEAPKEIVDVSEKKSKKNDEVDIEAIKKEDSELKEHAKQKPPEDKNQMLIDTIQKQNQFQQEIVEQHKKLIEVIQQQQQENKDINIVNEEKVKAVKEIESIAKKAIESISGQDSKKPVEGEVGKSVEKSNQTGLVKEHQELKVKMVPLPIALAILNNATDDLTKENDTKAIRRDTLSEDTKIRVRRQVEQVEQMSKAMKQVCEEVNKSTSTEKPIIKMLCKLSEPNLVPIELQELEKRADLKQQTRDVKQG